MADPSGLAALTKRNQTESVWAGYWPNSVQFWIRKKCGYQPEPTDVHLQISCHMIIHLNY